MPYLKWKKFMQIQPFFDKTTATVTYIVSDPATQRCAIIDPVLDYDPQAGTTATTSADRLIDTIKKSGLTVEWLLETHIHADHLTAAHYLKEKLGGKTGISDGIIDVLKYWVPIFDTADDTPLDGSQFDHLFADGETFRLGSLDVKVMHTPGHTPACACYIIEDAVFVGDTVFMPYGGTARADFPGGDAATLYRSIQKIFALPGETRMFICHDYPPEGQEASWETTVGEQKAKNKMINDGVSEASYIDARKTRDSKLPVPRLLYPSIQVNCRAGDLGETQENGMQDIKIPVKVA
jgi:glyoxylase-like metal-dependent hydrolase (beta-lactamase superfamily II)